MSDWSVNFRHALSERGVDPARIDQLKEEALEQAADHGLDPGQVFGPATAYADQVASCLLYTSDAADE